MVVGKLLILLSGSIVFTVITGVAVAESAGPVSPTFYSYSGGTFVNRIAEMSFGYFRTLDDQQKEAYYSALTHAVMYTDNGNSVQWYQGDASGYAVPVFTWPTGSGYCRRIHIQTIAYNREKTQTATACYDNAHSNWRWVSN